MTIPAATAGMQAHGSGDDVPGACQSQRSRVRGNPKFLRRLMDAQAVEPDTQSRLSKAFMQTFHRLKPILISAQLPANFDLGLEMACQVRNIGAIATLFAPFMALRGAERLAPGHPRLGPIARPCRRAGKISA